MQSALSSKLASLLAVAGLVGIPARVSDPVGVYALVDRVQLSPDSLNPTTIRIWGTFALSDGKGGGGYLAPQRGSLYYSINDRNSRATLAEWSDLKAAAGTGRAIAFGGRYVATGRVRSGSESASAPDVYPLGVGVVRVPMSYTNPSIEKELMGFPRPDTPEDGGRVAAGTVQLVTRNVPIANAKYFFDLTGPNGLHATSPAITAGTNGQTAWSPPVKLPAGQSYNWQVWVVDGTWRSQAATSAFRTNP